MPPLALFSAIANGNEEAALRRRLAPAARAPEQECVAPFSAEQDIHSVVEALLAPPHTAPLDLRDLQGQTALLLLGLLVGRDHHHQVRREVGVGVLCSSAAGLTT